MITTEEVKEENFLPGWGQDKYESLVGITLVTLLSYLNRTEMPPMHKPAPPPTKKNSDMKGGLISDDIQVGRIPVFHPKYRT